jgi:hypothetical protein
MKFWCLLSILFILPMNNCDPESTTQTPSNSTDSIRSQLLFTGDDQKRTDLGVNLGPIDYSMPQWVFTNKFKHGKCGFQRPENSKINKLGEF